MTQSLIWFCLELFLPQAEIRPKMFFSKVCEEKALLKHFWVVEISSEFPDNVIFFFKRGPLPQPWQALKYSLCECTI